MRAKYWLIGCILFAVGTSAAMASSRNGQDMDNTSRTITESASSQREGSGDVTDLTSHNSAPHASVRDATDNSLNNSDRAGGNGSAPAPVRQRHLGWQSLLPGSIQ